MTRLTVLITGSSRGIGLGLVREYVKGGHRVVATCRSPDKASELKEILSQAGQIPAISCDTSEDQSIGQCFQVVKDQVGKIDILINNAGISNADHPYEPPSKVVRKEFLDILNTNVAGVLAMTQAFLPLLAPNAKVVNISSTLGSLDLVDSTKCTSYRCSKAALNMATRTLALELPDLTFLAIHPGWVQTDMGSAKNRSPPVKIEDSALGIVTMTEKLESDASGTFWSYDGTQLPF